MNKFERLMRSRKFWALVAGVAAIVSGYLAGVLPIHDAIQALIAALAAYMVGTGLEDQGGNAGEGPSPLPDPLPASPNFKERN